MEHRCLHVALNLAFCWNRVLVKTDWCSEQNSKSQCPFSLQLPILCLPRAPFHSSKSRPTLVLKCPKNKKFVFGVNLLQEIMQIAVEDLLCSSFSLQSWCIHNDDSAKRVVLDWSLRDNDQLASFAVFWQRKF